MYWFGFFAIQRDPIPPSSRTPCPSFLFSASHVFSWSFSFLICKEEIILVPNSQDSGEDSIMVVRCVYSTVIYYWYT